MTPLLKFWFFLIDVVLLNVAVILSIFLVNDTIEIQHNAKYLYLFAFSNLAWIFLSMVSTPYNLSKGWQISRILKGQSAFLFIHLLVVAALVIFLKQRYSVTQILIIYSIFIPGFFIFRVITLYVRNVFTQELQYKNYGLIGRNTLSEQIRKYFLVNPEARYRFKGYIEVDGDKLPVAAVQKFCEEQEVQEVFLCRSLSSPEELKELIEFGMDSLIKVKVITDLDPRGKGIQFEQFGQLPGINISAIPLDEARNQFIKRVFDIIFSTLFCALVLSWLVPLIGLIIKIDSRGPVFFVQLRSGKDNRPFKCLKFRTMVVNTESESKQATRNDSRITKLGQFLRKTSIDELPQFLNVFSGSMSVVGPRPHMLKHTDEYSRLIEKFMGRHYVKPGVTGLAQCLGYRGETKELIDMENRVRMDRYYIENWTFWLDIKIIFLTVISLVRGSDKAF